MTQAAHTPGPWMPDESSGICNVTGAHGRSICSTGGYQNNAEDVRKVRTENEANAARIVACVNACEGLADPSVVPELVTALECVTDDLEAEIEDRRGSVLQRTLDRDLEAVHQARAAIAKARGQ